MSLITLLLFLVYSYGLGFAATKFTKNSEDFIERNLIRIGVGLAIIPVILVIFNLVNIPSDWRIFLALSLISPVYSVAKTISKRKKIIKEDIFKKDRHHTFIYISIIIAFLLFLTYFLGSLKYPYLEDDDPWQYSEAAKYVSVEKNLDDHFDIFKFLDPYPPAYAGLMGLLHQTSSSMSWTLKFFNSLIIALGIIFFYFFARKFTNNEETALFSTFVLAVLPSFFTHFIWAIGLAVTLSFVVLYCLEKINNDRKWFMPLTLVVFGFMLTQPSKILKILILVFVYLAIKSFYQKKFLKAEFSGVFSGILLSGIWWFNNLEAFFLSRAEGADIPSIEAEGVSTFVKIKDYLFSVFSPTSGTDTRPYSFNDFFIAKSQGGINVHVGFGIVATILLIIGIIYIIRNYKMLKEKNNYWISVVLMWFFITFINVNSATFNLPIGFFSFRTWLIMAIPSAFLCSLGFEYLKIIGRKIDIPSVIILLIVVAGLAFTSFYPKYTLNNSLWPPGQGWTSMEEVSLHSWLITLPDNAKVFSYGGSPVIGFDKYSCVWCKEEVEFLENIGEKSQDEVYSFLKSRNYEYLLISGKAIKHLGKKYGDEKATEMINEFITNMPSSRYQEAYQVSGGGVILRVT